jgi:hypothetical protein
VLAGFEKSFRHFVFEIGAQCPSDIRPLQLALIFLAVTDPTLQTNLKLTVQSDPCSSCPQKNDSSCNTPSGQRQQNTDCL